MSWLERAKAGYQQALKDEVSERIGKKLNEDLLSGAITKKQAMAHLKDIRVNKHLDYRTVLNTFLGARFGSGLFKE